MKDRIILDGHTRAALLPDDIELQFEETNKTIIKVEIYPATFQFIVDFELPKFEYGCETRGAILSKVMDKLEINSPCHAYEDYIVEGVQTNGVNTEIWQLGS